MSVLIDPLRLTYWALRRRALALRWAFLCGLPVDPAKIAAHHKIFLLSTGRTGTMFLAHFFDRHSANVRAFHEPYPSLLRLGLDTAVAHVTIEAAAAQLARDRRWYLQRLDRPTYLEANNRLFALAPAIQQAYPGAGIIHIVRDGRAVVRSGLARGWYGPADRFPRLAATDFPDDPWREAWAGWGELQKGAWLWQKQNRIIRRSAAHLPGYRLYRFEDLFAGQVDGWTAVRDLIRFIDPQLRLSDQALAAAFARKINAQALPAPPPPWTLAQDAAFTAIAGPEMAHYNYPRS